jgi:hypothetical protein
VGTIAFVQIATAQTLHTVSGIVRIAGLFWTERMIAMYEPPKRRRLSKAERQAVYEKCGGHCAYCGKEITVSEMQADHFVSLRRGGSDEINNMLPACRSCNHYKDTLTLEGLRDSIQKWPAVLERDSVTYRNAVRFGMIVPNPHPVQFYFEKIGLKIGKDDEDALH